MAARRSRLVVPLVAAWALVAGIVLVVAPAAGAQQSSADHRNDRAPVVFFAADGLRQDMVEKYAARRNLMPAMRELLRKGASATGGGLLTQAPPNTGAGWFTLATGAWPAVTGSTNNTFHINGQPFGNRTTAFDPGVLQAESIAQSAERGGKKVAQIEWAGGRSATIQGPTVDFRAFVSGRGVATNYIAPTDDPAFTRRSGCSSTTLSASPASRPSRRRRRSSRRGGPVCRPATAPRRRCACASSMPELTSTG